MKYSKKLHNLWEVRSPKITSLRPKKLLFLSCASISLVQPFTVHISRQCYKWKSKMIPIIFPTKHASWVSSEILQSDSNIWDFAFFCTRSRTPSQISHSALQRQSRTSLPKRKAGSDIFLCKNIVYSNLKRVSSKGQFQALSARSEDLPERNLK